MGVRCIVEGFHERVSLERGLNDPTLHAFPAAVNKAHLP